MAKIALRVYTREIEGLIEQGQLDEAIAHCRHILEAYPKHLGTYRLLGKANLEAKRYNDAADIFQRVLSSQPEDFVSNVGMSIIREDEGNLDAAIWHMERAFEVQPSNQAIQDELRRLYGRRDGIEPPKIRLTRGALARMYAHGGLHDQAIAELRASLSADPQRPDLQALLARMLFETGARVEAAEVATKLLEKLPFSFEANYLLSEILKHTDRADEVATHRRRVEEIDPYAAHMTPSQPLPDDAPDQAVTVDRLVWAPGRSEAAPPIFEETPSPSQAEDLPDWLSMGSEEVEGAAAMEGEEHEVGEAFSGIQEFAESEESGTPDWLAEIAATTPEDASDEEHFEAVTGETPEWLAEAIAEMPEEETREEHVEQVGFEVGEEQPEDGPFAPQAVLEINEEELTLEAGLEVGEEEWAEEQMQSPAPLPETGELEEGLAPADIPEWMLAMKPEDLEPSESILEELGSEMSQASGDEVPDWLQGLALEEQPESEAAGEEAADWLKDFGETSKDELPSEERVGEWLQSTGKGEPEEKPEEESTEEFAVSMPETSQEADLIAEGEDAMAWLESIDEDEEEAESSIQREEAEKAEGESLEAMLPSDQEAVEEESLDWLDRLGEKFQEEEGEAGEVEQVPEWLRDFRSGAPEEDEYGVEEALETERLAESEADVSFEAEVETEGEFAEVEEPSWLEEQFEGGEEPEQLSEAETEISFEAASEEVAGEESGEIDADEEAPAWLKDIEAASVQETAAPTRDSDVPEWLQGLTVPTGEEEEGSAPEWLADLTAAEEPAISETEAGQEPVSEWQLQSLDEARAGFDEPLVEPAAQEKPKMKKVPRQPKKSPSAELETARELLSSNRVEEAVDRYQKLVRRGRFVEEIIGDLKASLIRHPMNSTIWQTLGDAYMRADLLQDALDSYSRAERLIR